MARPKTTNQQLSILEKRKREIDEELEKMERQIYDLEGAYLEETQHVGNVLRGWESFLSSKPPLKPQKKPKIKDSDRLFSLSSVTSPAYTAAQAASGRDDDSVARDDPHRTGKVKRAARQKRNRAQTSSSEGEY
eukprot:c11286_g1_i1.p1 GENE.c11286_g1_i1~~c11286_g1_i1.p1  ORF type:complete len:134 (+),score=22.16 c11286_g1_i1:59-460(+)